MAPLEELGSSYSDVNNLSFCKAYSILENYTWNNELDSHFLRSKNICIVDMYDAIGLQQFFCSHDNLKLIIYRCLLCIGNTYLCRYYLCICMNQTLETKRNNFLQEIEEKEQEIKKIEDKVKEQTKSLVDEKKQLERIDRGLMLFENGHVDLLDENTSEVVSADGERIYKINRKEKTCQCDDAKYRGPYGMICMHYYADEWARQELDAPRPPVTFADAEELV